MSYGLPAIVPPVGGIAELVEDNRNGFRVEMNDRAHLAYSIRKILASDLDYARMSENAVKKASEFRSEMLVAQVSDLLMSL
jgi:glycosyltransferase involved in cell wall biosynthesis